jgi:hypothetical protein
MSHDDNLSKEATALIDEMREVAAGLPEEQRAEFWQFVAELCTIASRRQHAAQIKCLGWWPRNRHA